MLPFLLYFDEIQTLIGFKMQQFWYNQLSKMVKFIYYGLSKEILGYCTKSSNKKQLKKLANQLKTTACNKSFVSMSALQLGNTIQFFIVLNKTYIRQGQWGGYGKLRPANYNCFLNVEIKDHSIQSCREWEQCASYPGIKMLIQRPKAIRINHMDEELKDYMNQQYNGFEARVIQHEIDHHYGWDFAKKALQIQITNQRLKQKYQDQCNKLVQQFRGSLKQGQVDYKVVNYPPFNKLKQFLTYSIIDEVKQN